MKSPTTVATLLPDGLTAGGEVTGVQVSQKKTLLDAIRDTLTMAGGLYHRGLQEVTESS